MDNATQMTRIDILEFFRTGQAGSVAIGATREQVKASLGEPEDWWRHSSTDTLFTQAESPIWVYGGFEFYWYGSDETLSEISFKLHYLYWNKWKAVPDRWIFRRSKGPTVKRLRDELKRQAIPFQDTGLEMLAYHKKSRRHEVISLQELPADYDEDSTEIFGTLVLKSGVQVRYGDDNYLIKISVGGFWAVQGSEQFIKWE